MESVAIQLIVGSVNPLSLQLSHYCLPQTSEYCSGDAKAPF
jgi:hypothetical protein